MSKAKHLKSVSYGPGGTQKWPITLATLHNVLYLGPKHDGTFNMGNKHLLLENQPNLFIFQL